MISQLYKLIREHSLIDSFSDDTIKDSFFINTTNGSIVSIINMNNHFSNVLSTYVYVGLNEDGELRYAFNYAQYTTAEGYHKINFNVVKNLNLL